MQIIKGFPASNISARQEKREKIKKSMPNGMNVKEEFKNTEINQRGRKANLKYSIHTFISLVIMLIYLDCR